ncbi:MAG: ATPase, T2SS/T4P/T4SS family, partial [Patescibacteria group bacterium]
MPKKLLDILSASGDITANDIAEIRKEAAQKKISIEKTLIERGIEEQVIVRAKSEALGIPYYALNGKKINFDVLKLIPEESARHYQFVPLGIEENVLLIGMINPESTDAKEALNFIASRINQPFRIYVISQHDLMVVLNEYKGISGEASKVLGELEMALTPELGARQQKASDEEAVFVEDAPITKMVAVILRHATEGRASDIHIEPAQNQLRVRFRVDGVLYTSLLLPMNVHEAIISRVKILTNMLLDEKRKPQDGRFSAKIENREIDFRVSTFPTYFGEKVVMRIL